MSSWDLHRLQSLLHLPLISTCASELLYTVGPSWKAAFRSTTRFAWKELSFVPCAFSGGVFFFFSSKFVRSPRDPSAFLSLAYFSSLHSLLWALRPVLLSTKFSSFIRLGGITPSAPGTIFLGTVFRTFFEEQAKPMSWGFLDGDGEGRRRGGPRSTQSRFCGLSTIFSLGKVAVVFLCRTTSLLVAWFGQDGEILRSGNWNVVKYFKTNKARDKGHYYFYP